MVNLSQKAYLLVITLFDYIVDQLYIKPRFLPDFAR